MGNTGERKRDTVARRTFLGATGVVATGGLAGCLGRVAGAVTNTEASPAGAISGSVAGFGGVEGGYSAQNRIHDPTISDVEHVSATIRAGDGFLSAEVGLDGWLTDTTAKAQDYNSVRSNKRRSAFVPIDDSDGDTDDADEADDDGSVDVYTDVLALERELLAHIGTATDALRDEATADAGRALETVLTTIDEIRGALDGCDSDVCVAVRANADKRHLGTERAASAVDADDWETASEELEEVKTIVEEDSNRLEDAVGGQASADIDALYTYLDGDPTIGEWFSISLPDARLPRGGPAIADEITPRRIIQYLTGEARSCSADGELWCWGKNERARLGADLSEDTERRRGVAAYATDGGVCVTGVHADADVAEEMVALAPSHRDSASVTQFKAVPVDPNGTDGWGDELVEDDVAVSPTIVCPVVAKPEDAPVPFYALLSVTRCKHGDEYVYTGGWLIDDAALHEDSCTLIVAEGPTTIVGFTPDDAENRAEGRRKLHARFHGRRQKQGAVVYDGEIDDDVLTHLPDVFQNGDGLDGIVSLVASSSAGARTGRNPQTGKEIRIPARDGPGSDDATAMRCLSTALDCPIAHLTDGDGLSPNERAAAYDAFLSAS